jgi:hypothetical protein
MAPSAGLYILSAVLVAAGLAGVILPAIPGAILIFAGLVSAAWADHFHYVGIGTLLILGILTLLTYGLDILAGAFGVRKFGASKFAAVGAAIGAIVGIFFGLPGILLGPFLGAVLGELYVHGDLTRAGKAGIGAWIGLILGAAGKLAISFTMLGIFVFMRFF